MVESAFCLRLDFFNILLARYFLPAESISSIQSLAAKNCSRHKIRHISRSFVLLFLHPANQTIYSPVAYTVRVRDKLQVIVVTVAYNNDLGSCQCP
jgi:hypothetical protein